jgi:hypothetical protein
MGVRARLRLAVAVVPWEPSRPGEAPGLVAGPGTRAGEAPGLVAGRGPRVGEVEAPASGRRQEAMEPPGTDAPGCPGAM